MSEPASGGRGARAHVVRGAARMRDTMPHSKAELLAQARHETRLSLGRAAFVRDARVLPVGVPIALGLAALVYTRAVRAERRERWGWRGSRRGPSEAAGVAALVLAGAVALTYVEARVEWEVRRRIWDGRTGSWSR